MLIYIMGSMRNPIIRDVGNAIRENTSWEAFDDWHSGGPEADDYWQSYERGRGRDYKDALYSPHSQNIFELDKRYLNKADAGVLVMPAGKSAHIELGYLCGLGKPGYVLFDEEPERYDIMYQFCADVFFNTEELIYELNTLSHKVEQYSLPAGAAGDCSP